MTYQRLKQIAILWIAALILGSISPIEVKVAVGTETKSNSKLVKRKTFTQHRVFHFLGFGIAAALLSAISRTLPLRFGNCLLLIALGCFLEWLQYVALGSRFLETWDMRDDAIGVALGTLLAGAFRFGADARQRAFPAAFHRE